MKTCVRCGGDGFLLPVPGQIRYRACPLCGGAGETRDQVVAADLTPPGVPAGSGGQPIVAAWGGWGKPVPVGVRFPEDDPDPGRWYRR